MNVSAYHQQQADSLSYFAAQCVVCHLREMAKKEGFDESGIKVKITPQKYCKRVGAIIRVVWNEGPEDWANTLSIFQIAGVYVEAHEPRILSFYDI